MLVMAQAAVSVLLIVLATLFARATFRLLTIDVGFDASGLYVISPGLGDRVQWRWCGNRQLLGARATRARDRARNRIRDDRGTDAIRRTRKHREEGVLQGTSDYTGPRA
jgi:hypothetical protein